MLSKCTILGVPFTVQSRELLNALVREWMTVPAATGHVIVTPNPEFCVRATFDKKFRSLLAAADVRIPDGFGLVAIARVLWGVPLRRITGTDFLFDVIQLAAENHLRIFFLGAESGVAKQAAERFQKIYPGFSIVGAESGDGPDSSGGTAGVLVRLEATRPDVIIVALGAPQQERWIARYRGSLPRVRLFMGVGGALDYVSGSIPRAPYWLRRLGLEWVYRVWKQPQRLMRILVATVVFPVFALADRIRQLILRRSSGKI